LRGNVEDGEAADRCGGGGVAPLGFVRFQIWFTISAFDGWARDIYEARGLPGIFIFNYF
jgi:hypothetical protein